jgi:flagellar biosynthesis anti-sigma factor FlgM
MRIDPNQYLGNLQADNVPQPQKSAVQPTQSEESGEAGGVDTDDQFQPSPSLAQIQQLQALLAQMPDARTDRVTALSQQIQNGTYNPTNDQIANSMLGEMGVKGS